MNKYRQKVLFAVLLLAAFCVPSPASEVSLSTPLKTQNPAPEIALKDFLDKVYQTMDDHYYLPVKREIYDDFLKNYTAEKLIAFNNKSKQTDNFVHLGAGLLVNKLKSPKDKLTVFIPPKKSKEFKANAYAVTEDLGIEGHKKEKLFEITKVQKHCEAYIAGVRAGDSIIKINDKPVSEMSEEAIATLLKPELGSKTALEILFLKTGKTQVIAVESKSYFRETVEILPSVLPGALALKITHFNQKTNEDFADVLNSFGPEKIKNLVLDLRGNEGGPPLAAREILSYFTPPNDPLFAIARKKQRPVMLASASEPISYMGPIYILVNKKTGSAAEMFSGVMQSKKKAIVLGQPTAGATFLKSIYDFEDKSAIFMITSLTYFPDKSVFPEDGITPNIIIPEDQDTLEAIYQRLKSS